MLRFLKYLFQLIISPTNGWEDISCAGTEPRQLASDGFYPLLGIASATAFLRLLYNPALTLGGVLQDAIVIFAQYFVSFFLANYLMSVLLPPCIEGEINEKRVSTFLIYNLSLLALITVIENVTPIELSLVQFLPIIVVVVIWKGCRYMAVSERQTGRFMLISILSVIGLPLLLGYFFHLLAPAA